MKPYVVKSLPEHERLIALAQFPWIFRAASWVILVVLGAAPIFTMFALYLTEQLTSAWGASLLAGSIFGTVWFVCNEIYINSTEFGLTDQRVVVKRGVFGRRTAELPLAAVENVILSQSLMSRLFRFGRLQINGSGGSPIFSPPIADPVRFRAAITEATIAHDEAQQQHQAPARQRPAAQHKPLRAQRPQPPRRSPPKRGGKPRQR
ncbi:MAG: PH domain-containing protein [Pseudomonadota bacterium]